MMIVCPLKKYQCRDITQLLHFILPTKYKVLASCVVTYGCVCRVGCTTNLYWEAPSQLVYASWPPPATKTCPTPQCFIPVIPATTQHSRFLQSQLLSDKWPSNELWGHQEVITHSGNSSFQNLLLLVSGKLICAVTISENFPCNMENLHLSSFGADKR